MARMPESPGTYARITSKLYSSLDGLSADEALRAALLPRIADATIEACEPLVTASEPVLRLQQALAALRDEGLAYEASEVGGGFELRRQECRWSRLVGDSKAGIEQERRVLAALLGAEASQLVHEGVKFVYRLPVPAVRD